MGIHADPRLCRTLPRAGIRDRHMQRHHDEALGDRLALSCCRPILPEEWEKFHAGVPEGERDRNIVGAYARLMEHPDADVRTRAAIDWATWEDTVLSREPTGKLHPYGDRPLTDLLALVRIVTHYFSNGAWLDEGAL